MEFIKRILKINKKSTPTQDKVRDILSIPGYDAARKKMFNILYEYDTRKK